MLAMYAGPSRSHNARSAASARSIRNPTRQSRSIRAPQLLRVDREVQDARVDLVGVRLDLAGTVRGLKRGEHGERVGSDTASELDGARHDSTAGVAGASGGNGTERVDAAVGEGGGELSAGHGHR